jgi:GntR family transcriptional regulator
MVYRIERIRYANGEAVLLEETFIVADRFNGLQMFNFEKYSLYDVLYEHYGVELTYAKDIINSVWLTKTEAQILLGRDTGHALSTENITYDNDKKPVEYCNMKYNPDKFSYIVTSTKQTKKHATAEGMNKSMENEADKTINAGGNFNG